MVQPGTDFDLSGAAGFTFNGENPATDYRTGTEFHAEWAVTRHFGQEFSTGVAGYFYQQVTGDSGPGASLGDFKGRIAAIGGTMGYNFKMAERRSL
nr:transporter [Ensifer adhaerens]